MKVKVKIQIDYRGQKKLKLNNSEIPLQSNGKYQLVTLDNKLNILNNESFSRDIDLVKGLNQIKLEQYFIFFTRVVTNLKSSLLNRLSLTNSESFKAGIYFKETNSFKPLVQREDGLKIDIEHDLWAHSANTKISLNTDLISSVNIDLDFDLDSAKQKRLPPFYVISLKNHPQSSIPLLYSLLLANRDLKVNPVWAKNRKLSGDDTAKAKTIGFNTTILELLQKLQSKGITEIILLTDNTKCNSHFNKLANLIEQGRSRLADYIILDSSYLNSNSGKISLSKSKLNRLPSIAKNTEKNNNSLELLPAELYKSSHRAIYLNHNAMNHLMKIFNSDIELKFKTVISELPKSELKGLVVNYPIFDLVKDKHKKSYYPKVNYLGNGRNQKYPNKNQKVNLSEYEFDLNMPTNSISHPLRTLYQVRDYLFLKEVRQPKTALISADEIGLLDFDREQPHQLVTDIKPKKSNVDLELELELKLKSESETSFKNDYLEKNNILVYIWEK